MRFWEAIVRGAEKRPQCFGSWVVWEASEQGLDAIATCAQGAAFEALGLNLRTMTTTDIVNCPTIRAARDIRFDACPKCGLSVLVSSTQTKGEQWSLYTLVPHLNDIHRLTRPAIASIVYQYEREALGADPEDDARYREIFGTAEAPVEVKS